MHEPHSRLVFGLTLRYVLVLAVLAVLVTSNFLLLKREIELSSADSAVINTSGRQRMLSQRSALLSQQLSFTENAQALTSILDKLRQTQAMLDVTHMRLLGDTEGVEHGANLSPDLHALYFDGPNALDRHYHRYVDLLHEIIATPLDDSETLRRLARQIADETIEGTLLTQLDDAVLQYQQASELSLTRIATQQRWVWLATLATLLYMAFGVFRPMVLRIRNELRELNDIKVHLVQRVRERTREVQRLAQAMEASAEAIVITDTQGIIQYVNNACSALNGYTNEELIGQHTRVFRGDTRETANYDVLWPTIRSGQAWVGDVINARKDGSHYNARLTIAPIRGETGDIEGFVGIQSDITLMKQTESRLQSANLELDRLATEDPLTGIANRRVFDRTLVEEWARARRADTPLGLIMIDIDLFKAYNDRFGHQQGDECLRRVAEAMQQVLSRPGDRVVRYGGEEFAVLLPDTTAAGGREVAESIRVRIAALALPAADTAVSPYVSVSLGVASLVPGRNQPATALIAQADSALYKAKQDGRNRTALA